MRVLAGVIAAGLVGGLSISLAQEENLSWPAQAQEAAAKAREIRSYRAHFTLEAQDEEGPLQMEGELAFLRPNRRHLKLRRSPNGELMGEVVSDGRVEWQYDLELNRVYRVKVSTAVPGPHRPFEEILPETLRFIERRQGGREAQLRFEGKPRPALVEQSPVPVETIRIDVGAEDGLIRELTLLDQGGKGIFHQRYMGLETNVTFPEGEFVFTPPPGVPVTEMEQPAQQ